MKPTYVGFSIKNRLQLYSFKITLVQQENSFFAWMVYKVISVVIGDGASLSPRRSCLVKNVTRFV
jgi:hypothetical protein